MGFLMRGSLKIYSMLKLKKNVYACIIFVISRWFRLLGDILDINDRFLYTISSRLQRNTWRVIRVGHRKPFFIKKHVSSFYNVKPVDLNVPYKVSSLVSKLSLPNVHNSKTNNLRDNKLDWILSYIVLLAISVD